jgi:hypothetical protein
MLAGGAPANPQLILPFDQSLEVPKTGAEAIPLPIREKAAARNSSLYGMFCYLKRTSVFPQEAFREACRSDRISDKIDLDSLLA